MRSLVKVYQIYYDDSQKAGLEPEFIPIKNYSTTVFFEAKVMVDLINQGKHKGADYFGVLSPTFRRKIADGRRWGPIIKNRARPHFTAKSLEIYLRQNKPSICSLTNHRPHSVFWIAERFHKGIVKATKAILDHINYRCYWDAVTPHVIYFNYFVATPKVYEHFVKSLLEPAIHAMETVPHIKKLCDINSNYRKPVTPELEKQIGRNYYPLHPFITERLINVYTTKNSATLKIIHW